MGYYNPIYIYGVDKFLADAKSAGVDGLIVVDLPPEEDEELCLPALKSGLNFIRLATPTTDDKRLPAVLANTSGFVYYVSITGITGMAAPDTASVTEAVARIKRHTKLPVAVGFGVKTADHARAIAQGADGVVVGSALIDALKATLDGDGRRAEAPSKRSPISCLRSPRACAVRAPNSAGHESAIGSGRSRQRNEREGWGETSMLRRFQFRPALLLSRASLSSLHRLPRSPIRPSRSSWSFRSSRAAPPTISRG